MLTVENLKAGYGPDKEVLKGINFSMETGKIHGLVGLNGAGKTTLLNTLYSFIRPDTGTLTFNGVSLQRKDIGYLEAENYFYPYITGHEYLELFPAGVSGFDPKSWQELLRLPLEEITESYSTGMRKKLALIAVIKMDKPIFILDEPFNGLDLESAHILSLILEKLREKGKTILITSHIYESLTGISDYIHYLENGTISYSYHREQFEELRQLLHATINERANEWIQQLL